MSHVPLLIIGSGPAGYTAAIYAARAELKPVVLTGQESGGQLMLTTDVENFPGFVEGVPGPELMFTMRSQAERFGAELVDEYATFVDLTASPFAVWTTYPEGMSVKELFALPAEQYLAARQKMLATPPTYTSDAIILSMGASTVWLNVPGEQELIGKGVSSCAVCDAAFFKDKDTVVVGGGDSAMEDTLALTKFAKSVTVVHRRDAFRASKIMQQRVLSHPKVKVIWNSSVKHITGTSKVEGVVIETLDPQTQKTAEQTVAADGVFVAIGHTPVSRLVAGAVALDAHGFILTRQSLTADGVKAAQAALSDEGLVQFPTMTSVEGVFAAGDIVDIRYKQAITAAGQGCQAALDAERYLESKQ